MVCKRLTPLVTMLSRVGSMAVQQEHFFMSGDGAFLASAPALVDPLAPNSATTLRLRSHLTMQPTADVLAGVFTTASYKNVDMRPLDASRRVTQVIALPVGPHAGQGRPHACHRRLHLHGLVKGA